MEGESLRGPELAAVQTPTDNLSFASLHSASANGPRLGRLSASDPSPNLRFATSPSASGELSPAELAAIIVSAVVVAAVLVGAVIWIRCRTRKTKSHPITVELTPPPQITTVATVTQDYQRTLYPHSNGYSHNIRIDDEVIEWGSVTSSVPPSPSLSFRSVADYPPPNRSRAGTGTSFKSFTSVGTGRTRSSISSFHTCKDERIK